MKTAASYYATSPGTFQTRSDYLWHRRFLSVEQKDILESSGASLVTYFVEHNMPFGKPGMTETTVMKIPLRVTNTMAEDLTTLVSILSAFSPDGYELAFDDDTYENEEAVLVMWWAPNTATRKRGNIDPTGTETQCIISDDPEFGRLTRELGEGVPVYVYGGGPWLISDRPLTDEHARLLMEVRK